MRGETAENDQLVGELQLALAHLDRALREIEGMQQVNRPANDQNHAYLLAAHARLLVEVGRPDDALVEFEQARGLLTADRDRAIRLGDIARLLAAKREVDQALKLHQDELALYVAASDSRGIANTLWSIARVKIRQQHSQLAFGHYAISYAICLKIGNLVAICHVGLDFARLLCDLGRYEKCLSVLERSRDGFIELGRPGDARYVQSKIDEIQSNRYASSERSINSPAK